MMHSRAVLVDVHDVVYDISQWEQWFAQSLRQIGVDVSFCGCWDFEPFPYARRLSADYLFELNRFLTEIGLNEGQKREFLTAVRFEYSNWLRRACVFSDASHTLGHLQRIRVPVSLFGAWKGSRQIEDFLGDLGLQFQPDQYFVHENSRLSANLAMRTFRSWVKRDWPQCLFVSRNGRWLDLASRLGMDAVGLDMDVPEHVAWRSIPRLSGLRSLCERHEATMPLTTDPIDSEDMQAPAAGSERDRRVA